MDQARFTVLIVDDEVLVRRLIRRALKAIGIDSIDAASAAEGQEAFLTHPGGIDLVIVDMVIPGMSGLDLAAELERERPGVPILYISGSGDSIAMKSIQRQSADRVLLKPFDPKALVERVWQLLEAGGLRPVHPARLVFSSFGEPLREGTRGAAITACHLLFEEGNWLLDLHVKPQPDRNLVCLAGQILERVPRAPLGRGHTVTVLSEQMELARTATNDRGEFQLEVIPGGSLTLSVKLTEEFVMVADLQEFASAKGSSGR